MSRRANIERSTLETKISVTVNLDGHGSSKIDTAIGFFDHLLSAWSKHAGIDLDLIVRGDLHIDQHHTVEDTGIVLGGALEKALGDRSGITRFGHAYCPLDESLARSVVDISGRGYLVFNSVRALSNAGEFQGELLTEFLRAVAINGKFTLHMDLLRGENQHHMQEALMKSFARAFRIAVTPDERQHGVASTKGILV
ncbi:imidazoleglycerol-phosphate dehydratase HisB [candidate division KSB1 bacterium]|nr:imidazoleglycerol-phosphate dehydratase HisB [candidate division KSB1 bacterium]